MLIVQSLILALSALGFTVVIGSGEIGAFYHRWLMRLPEWLYKPLGGCAKCFGGQLALWSWFYFRNNIFEHLLMVLMTIAITYFLEKILTKWGN